MGRTFKTNAAFERRGSKKSKDLMMHDGGFRMDTEYCRSLCVGVWQKGHTDQHHFRC